MGAATARQVAREDLLTARVREPSERITTREKPITSTTAPPNSTQITNPSSGPGMTAPMGVIAQGPSPVDYSLELENKVSKGHGARNARKCCKKNVQNSNRTL